MKRNQNTLYNLIFHCNILIECLIFLLKLSTSSKRVNHSRKTGLAIESYIVQETRLNAIHIVRTF